MIQMEALASKQAKLPSAAVVSENAPSVMEPTTARAGKSILKLYLTAPAVGLCLCIDEVLSPRLWSVVAGFP